MKNLSSEELGLLMQTPGNPAVSIYLPTQRTGDIEQNQIRLKNLLREAEKQLLEYGLRRPDALSLLEPAQQLLPDLPFWRFQSDGLAVFSSRELFRQYRLPRTFRELAVVAERFHVKPLIPLFSEDGVFYVLALSQNQARLLQCTRYNVQDVTPAEMPSGKDEALKHDDPEKQHQFRTTGPGGATLFHGHGVAKDYDKDDTLRYFHRVERGMQEVLSDEHAPLVIAGVDYLHSIYREATKYRYLLDEGIEGNPDDRSDNELQERAWPVVQKHFDRERGEALDKYSEALAKELATSDLKEAVLAAYDGRIATLFVAAGVHQWGKFDEESRKILLYDDRKPGIEDLLDLAAVHTLTKKGIVYSLDPEKVPGETAIAAILRYRAGQ
ncbi:MAG: hypothetical protein ACNA7X_01410 [Dehalococcoidia bacterium]